MEHQLKQRIAVVEVPPSASDISLRETSEGKPTQLFYIVDEPGLYITNQRLVILPHGKWKNPIRFEDLTEEQAGEIMREIETQGDMAGRIVYHNYRKLPGHKYVNTALESLQSFLTANWVF